MSAQTTAEAKPGFYAIVPAAGVGARVGHATPKQYLPLAGRSALAWVVDTLLAAPWIEQVLVAVAPGDREAERILAGAARSQPRLRIAALGGATRRDTVLAAMRALHGAQADDFVLVHDAARPGLTAAALDRLRVEAGAHRCGGLLALPVDDTVKSAGPGGEVRATVPRAGLWLAQTPQMFRNALLRDALARHPEVTDEAGAIEADGHAALLVRGERGNFKVTTAEDLATMDALLRCRGSG